MLKPYKSVYSNLTFQEKVEMHEGIKDILTNFRQEFKDRWKSFSQKYKDSDFELIFLDFIMGSIGALILLLMMVVYMLIRTPIISNDMKDILMLYTNSSSYEEVITKLKTMDKDEKREIYEQMKNSPELTNNFAMEKESINILKRTFGLPHSDFSGIFSGTKKHHGFHHGIDNGGISDRIEEYDVE